MMNTPQEESVPATGRTPAEESAQQDSCQTLTKLLSALPAKQQEVIRLKFQQHLSYREIARCTKLSESNVGWLIHTGIKTLREQMINL